MQWWRDVLAEVHDDGSRNDGIGGGVEGGYVSSALAGMRSQNPVVRELKRAAEEHDLAPRFLERLLEAREDDLGSAQPESVRDLIRYGEATHSGLIYLALECAGVRDEIADEAASNVGIGLTLVTALRSTVYRASALGEISIPGELMERHGVPSRYLVNLPKRDIGKDLTADEEGYDRALRGAVRDMAYLASSHLSQARRLQMKVPKDGRLALLPAVGALTYLRKLEQVEFDVLHTDLLAKEGFSAQKDKLYTLLFLGRAWLTGVF